MLPVKNDGYTKRFFEGIKPKDTETIYTTAKVGIIGLSRDGKSGPNLNMYGNMPLWFIFGFSDVSSNGGVTDHGYGWISPIQPNTRLSVQRWVSLVSNTVVRLGITRNYALGVDRWSLSKRSSTARARMELQTLLRR